MIILRLRYIRALHNQVVLTSGSASVCVQFNCYQGLLLKKTLIFISRVTDRLHIPRSVLGYGDVYNLATSAYLRGSNIWLTDPIWVRQICYITVCILLVFQNIFLWINKRNRSMGPGLIWKSQTFVRHTKVYMLLWCMVCTCTKSWYVFMRNFKVMGQSGHLLLTYIWKEMWLPNWEQRSLWPSNTCTCQWHLDLSLCKI